MEALARHILLPLAIFLTVSTHNGQGITIEKGTSSSSSTDQKTRFSPYLSGEVPCNDDQTYCECKTPDVDEVCTFSELRVEELQTFVSYHYKEEKDSITQFMNLLRLQTKASKHDSAGDVYYLSGRGFTPALPPKPDNPKTFQPPEYGKCFFENISVITEETFRANKTCSIPTTVDGATYRMFIGVNGQIPGPTLIAYENQVVRIRVRNKLTSEAISVHWHGFHQENTPWMDGVGFISQPPILPGAYFDYVFNVGKAGTYWYHSHVGAQRTDGLYGAFIVKEAEGKTLNDYTALTDGISVKDFPENKTITLLDWQRETSLNIFVRIHSTLGFFLNNEVGRIPNQFVDLNKRTRSVDGVEIGAVPFWSGLINGKGRHTRETYSILSNFTVEKGSRYRFRLVGAQSLYAFKVSIDMHKLILIASDSRFIEPETVDYIIIHSGERYDFILDAYQEVGNYWIRAETLEANLEEGSHMAEAILHYEGAEKLNPWNKYVDIPVRPRKCSLFQWCRAVNCPFERFPRNMFTRCIHLDELSAFIPPDDDPAPRVPCIINKSDLNLLFFNFGFEGRSDTSAINGMNFHLPATPYQTYCDQYERDQNSKGGDDDSRLCRNANTIPPHFPSCIHVKQIAKSPTFYPHAETYPSVNFVLSAVGNFTARLNDFSHPIHLHGHHFRVVAVRHGTYDYSGKLVANNKDVTCCKGDDCSMFNRCPDPGWTDGTPPSFMRPGRVSRNAILKDTVIVPAGGYVVIAFEADNPGYWFMHCHIEAHQLEGMAVIIQEYPSNQQWQPPPNINRIGNFHWTATDYKNIIKSHQKCPVPPGNL